MKVFPLLVLASALGFLTSGCSHLDTTPPASADRVLTGFVTSSSTGDLPANSEVTVRVVDASVGEVIGEQTIQNPGRLPVPYRIEFQATDALLIRGVNVEARISVAAQLRYVTATAHPVTIGNVSDSHSIEVMAAASH